VLVRDDGDAAHTDATAPGHDGVAGLVVGAARVAEGEIDQQAGQAPVSGSEPGSLEKTQGSTLDCFSSTS
jgi:hypothetical protein